MREQPGSFRRGNRLAAVTGLAAFAMLVLLSYGGGPIGPVSVEAAQIDVDVLNDPTPGSCAPGDCSLREAIIEANGDTAQDSIVLQDGATYTLTLDGDEDVALTGDLDIAAGSSLIIEVAGGASARATVTWDDSVSDADRDRVFHVLAGASLELRGITVSGGRATDEGGGIFNGLDGTVELTNSTVSGNTASGDFGGGIFNNGGTVELTNSTVSGNTVSGDSTVAASSTSAAPWS